MKRANATEQDDMNETFTEESREVGYPLVCRYCINAGTED